VHTVQHPVWHSQGRFNLPVPPLRSPWGHRYPIPVQTPEAYNSKAVYSSSASLTGQVYLLCAVLRSTAMLDQHQAAGYYHRYNNPQTLQLHSVYSVQLRSITLSDSLTWQVFLLCAVLRSTAMPDSSKLQIIFTGTMIPQTLQLHSVYKKVIIFIFAPIAQLDRVLWCTPPVHHSKRFTYRTPPLRSPWGHKYAIPVRPPEAYNYKAVRGSSPHHSQGRFPSLAQSLGSFTSLRP
jgi:hypothetical protein